MTGSAGLFTAAFSESSSSNRPLSVSTHLHTGSVTNHSTTATHPVIMFSRLSSHLEKVTTTSITSSPAIIATPSSFGNMIPPNGPSGCGSSLVLPSISSNSSRMRLRRVESSNCRKSLTRSVRSWTGASHSSLFQSWSGTISRTKPRTAAASSLSQVLFMMCQNSSRITPEDEP